VRCSEALRQEFNLDEGIDGVIDEERDDYLHEPRADEIVILPEKETWPTRLGFSRRSDE
jgi:hypothetical protein